MEDRLHRAWVTCYKWSNNSFWNSPSLLHGPVPFNCMVVIVTKVEYETNGSIHIDSAGVNSIDFNIRSPVDKEIQQEPPAELLITSSLN